MTRGQKGCYIYCTDKNLAEYLKRRLNKNNGIEYLIDEEERKYTSKVAGNQEEYRCE